MLFFFFFPRCRPVLGPALRGETLPQPGQAAQKQMRSDTGAKEDSPEPLGARITKCSSPRSLCSVSTLHAQITDVERGRLLGTGRESLCISIPSGADKELGLSGGG